MSSTVTDRFIRGQTRYLFFCKGWLVRFILARGKSLNAGFLCFMLVLNLSIASPCLYPSLDLSSIFNHLSFWSFLFRQGQLVLFLL